MDRQAEGELGQAVGWLVSATEWRQCLTYGGRTGQVAKHSGLRKEGHNTGREGNGGETGGNWYLVEGACLMKIGYKRDKERCGRSVGVVLRI